jgi:hypothetical protein
MLPHASLIPSLHVTKSWHTRKHFLALYFILQFETAYSVTSFPITSYCSTTKEIFDCVRVTTVKLRFGVTLLHAISYRLGESYVTLSTELQRCLGRDSLVGRATRYGLDGLDKESRWRRGSPYPFRPALGVTRPPIQWVSGLFPVGKADGAGR